jgi:PDZ domain
MRERANWTVNILKGASLFSGLLCLSCANPFHDYYTSTTNRWPSAFATLAMPAGSNPDIASTTDMKKDAHTLLEQGYVMVGHAKFELPIQNESSAVDQAKKVGAWLVVVDHEFAETVTEQVPQVTIQPDQTVVNVKDFTDRRGEDRSVTETTTVPGQTDVNWVPEDVDYYNYNATFWARTAPTPLGLLVRGPRANAAKPVTLSPNGLLVQVVVMKSPADLANVQEGDYLKSINGENLLSVDQYYDAIDRAAGQQAVLGLVRGGQPLSITVTLNPAPAN